MILNCVDEDMEGFKCSNPNSTVECLRNEDMFDNDAGLAVDNRTRAVVEKIFRGAQIHEKYLYITGGKLALEK